MAVVHRIKTAIVVIIAIANVTKCVNIVVSLIRIGVERAIITRVEHPILIAVEDRGGEVNVRSSDTPPLLSARWSSPGMKK
jgi:hypothetical protein